MSENNTKFQPIYVWAQSLDNMSDDDFYEITSKRINFVENLTKKQYIVSEMGDVSQKGKSFADVITQYTPTNQKGINKIVYLKSKKQLLINYISEDKDNLNRASSIDVLFDLNSVSKIDFVNYVNFFYQGLQSFSQKTNRHPVTLKDSEKSETLHHILNHIFSSTTNQENIKNKNTYDKYINSKNLLILVIVVVIFFIIFLSSNGN